MRASRIQLSEPLGAASWPELGLVFESDSPTGLVPVVHPAFPSVVCTSLPVQQESVYPYPPDKTWHGLASAGTFSGKQWKHSPSRAAIASDNGTDSAG
jgi:hypothetical protein